MKSLTLVGLVAGLALLFALYQASGRTGLFADNFGVLLAVNIGVAGVLALVVSYQGVVLWRRVRSGVFGARLSLRLLWMFGLMAVVPGALVYGVSLQFLTRSIESWFNVRMDNALAGGLSLGHTALEHLLRELTKKGEGMANKLAELPSASHVGNLNELREQAGVQETMLYSEHGELIGFSSTERVVRFPERPSSSVLWQIRQQQPYARIESKRGGGLFLRVVVPVNLASLTETVRVLQLVQPVPAGLAADAEVVQQAYQEYQQLAVSRVGLKRLYGYSLTLTLLLALLATLALAVLLSEALGAPLRLLAMGTRAIAKGDFSQLTPVKSRDELGVLTQSFNLMTQQLAEARDAAELSRQQTEKARAYLESLLSNLTSGVVAFDDGLGVRIVNRVAGQMLGVDLSLLRGRKPMEWAGAVPALAGLGATVDEKFREYPDGSWQAECEYDGPHGAQVLLLRGNHLPAGIDNGFVLVFDDITNLIQAQRNAAWGEVARRLAHEIKNPLTPIQLSAERLEKRIADKLPPHDADMVRRATGTIVAQVSALKSMVDAFAQYAKLPSAQIRPVDLNSLIDEVLTLYPPERFGIVAHLGENLPRVAGDLGLLRRVLHNLLQNSQDALEGAAQPSIKISTAATENGVTLTVEDNGPGFPDHLMAKLFEPYATTKPKGTGLGLAIVKRIVDDHQGHIEVRNASGGGACIAITLPIATGGGQ